MGICPIPSGKSGVYVYQERESAYNKKLKATEAFEELITLANAQCIIFHYTDNGLIKPQDARDILLKREELKKFLF